MTDFLFYKERFEINPPGRLNFEVPFHMGSVKSQLSQLKSCSHSFSVGMKIKTKHIPITPANIYCLVKD